MTLPRQGYDIISDIQPSSWRHAGRCAGGTLGQRAQCCRSACDVEGEEQHPCQ
jgi:hypothetical protein